MRKVKCVSFAFVISLGIAALGVAAQDTTSKPQSAQPPNPGTKTDSPGTAVDPNKYLIGPEDILFIKTWREPDWTWLAVVRPDGKITVPLSGELQAGGVTPIQLTKGLTAVIGKYVNNPEVDVFVQEVRSKKYYIDGEVNRPGSFPLVTRTNVLEALSNAGGFREFASPKKIRILRGSQTFRFNYFDVTKGKHMEQNIDLENGDHIIVP